MENVQKQLPVVKIKSMVANLDVKKRFEDMLGKKAASFMASIVNAVSTNSKLQMCDTNSIMSAAFIAASFDLPIDSNLGFSAIIPYSGKAQFQMMYKGFIQLAIRSAQYKHIQASEVYQDELLSYNPITGIAKFIDIFPTDSQRNRGEKEKICGYFSWFELINGFSQQIYMTVDEIENHAKQYSKSYGYDKREKKQTSNWSTDFHAMARKTVIKLLLSKWGILSIDMQRALTEDQKILVSQIGNDNIINDSSYSDNPKTETDKTISDPFAKKENEPKIEPQAKSPQADLIPDSPDPKTGTYKEKFNTVWDELEASGMKVEEIANKLFVKGFRSDPQAETDEKEQKRILKYLESLKGK